MMDSSEAIRAVVHSDAEGVDFVRDAILRRARELLLMGWVRDGENGTVHVHAEGDAPALSELATFLHRGVPLARVAGVEIEEVRVEGHEQFAIRGVSAGAFVVLELAARAHHFDLRLEVGETMRSWILPKGPSMDPAVKRLAIEAGDRDSAQIMFESTLDGGAMIVWDHGTYEQGGRVAWPQALARGHAAFVLHGEKLRGGFGLQRTRAGAGAQWLLIKRRDDEARPLSDIVAERPHSVLSGRTLYPDPGPGPG